MTRRIDARRHGSPTRPSGVLALILLGALLGSGDATAKSFWAFETGPVRPLAISPDGSRLFVTNVPDQSLEIFSLSSTAGPVHEASVAVGLEPCAVAVRNDDEVWVVNHLSDSISIVDVAATPPRVVRTLLVGDEPRDLVFGGANGERAFVTTAHRGQNHPNDPQLTTPGVGRADVWVFDANALGDPLTGTPITILQLFADTPRSLARSADGSVVYAAAFHSGNRTMTRRETFLDPVLAPLENTLAPVGPTPRQGRILGFDGSDWRDASGAAVPPGTVRFRLPDEDVFEIDADAPIPTLITTHSGVGTILFDLAVHPTTGKLYVANTDANNLDRFEGFSAAHGSLRGELHRARVTVIDGATVDPRALNKHLAALPEYAAEGDPTAKDASLATPVALAFSDDGAELYVAAFGSSRIGVFSTSELETDTFVPDPANHIVLSGGGPAGLVVDAPRGLLYVYTRFDNALAVVDPERRVELFSRPLHDREPAVVRDGRRFLYDARLSSSNGEASCSACHVFGDLDSLAWNLGDPDLAIVPNDNPIVPSQAGVLVDLEFHPLKGPMTTQTLRGMDGHGPMHWRGDRTAVAGGGVATDELGNFLEFNAAFVGLLGRQTQLTQPEMTAFAEFVLELVPPPNPIRALDNGLSPSEQLGHDIFVTSATDGGGACTSCHTLDPAAGFFGTSGNSANIGDAQEFKVPHLRNAYQKVGRFGMDGRFSNLGSQLTGDPTHDQIRGFGFLHDGSFDTLASFLEIFTFGSAVTDFGLTDEQEAVDAVTDFVFAFPSVVTPAVGQQVTLLPPNPGFAELGRLLLLESRTSGQAALNECDLVARTVVDGEARGFLFRPTGNPLLYLPDRAGARAMTTSDLLAHIANAGEPVTFTCFPPGSGERAGIDRDEDGVLDGDDNCRTAPNGPNEGTCTAGEPSNLGGTCDLDADCGAEGACSQAQEDTDGDGKGNACDPVFVPEPTTSVGLAFGALLIIGTSRRSSR